MKTMRRLPRKPSNDFLHEDCKEFESKLLQFGLILQSKVKIGLLLSATIINFFFNVPAKYFVEEIDCKAFLSSIFPSQMGSETFCFFFYEIIFFYQEGLLFEFNQIFFMLFLLGYLEIT
ncbi:hypothetical protein FGO68_gene3861 [Halteria grandinella]|uniref:Uncharacterized protein n=1 Tax=Halteria grandinella TaxID=5974 RepID=A0A8J8NH36_HALGN|nr:hypothetical protein FGO68_gene3861 [Halteria grandinella]